MSPSQTELLLWMTNLKKWWCKYKIDGNDLWNDIETFYDSSNFQQLLIKKIRMDQTQQQSKSKTLANDGSLRGFH